MNIPNGDKEIPVLALHRLTARIPVVDDPVPLLVADHATVLHRFVEGVTRVDECESPLARVELLELESKFTRHRASSDPYESAGLARSAPNTPISRDVSV